MVTQVPRRTWDIIDGQPVCHTGGYSEANELGYPIGAAARRSTAGIERHPRSAAGHLRRLAWLKSALPCKRNFRSIIRKGRVRSTREYGETGIREYDVDEIPAIFGLWSFTAVVAVTIALRVHGTRKRHDQ
jgi:hypothetical protein